MSLRLHSQPESLKMINIRLQYDRIIFFYLLILHLLVPISGIRLDVSLQVKKNCRTTVQGRYLLSDDDGYVCDTLSLDPHSRCCLGKGEQYSCQGCNLSSACCNSYEFCVSCCLSPSRTQKDLALMVKIAKPVTAGTYSSVFDYCAGRCRHNSESVVLLVLIWKCGLVALTLLLESKGSHVIVFASRMGNHAFRANLSCLIIVKLCRNICAVEELVWLASEQINPLKSLMMPLKT